MSREMERAGRLARIHAAAFDAPWSARDFALLLAQPGVFALDDGDGFILVRRAGDEAEVLTLAVTPPSRRRGLARALVEAASAALAEAGVAELRLEVAVDNAAGLALYAAAGFSEVGRRPLYYARQEGARVDALILLRRLNTPPASAYLGG